MAEESDAGTEERTFSRRQLLLGGGLLTVIVFALTRSERDLFENEGVEAVLNAHAAALEAGDLDAYMATLHPDSPITEAEAATNLDREPQRVDIFVGTVETDDREAEAETVLDLYENEETGEGEKLVRTYTLRQDEGEWLIENWETSERRPLDESSAE